ncbi:MAG: glutamine-hydrolyzing GMP synthase [Pseudomonadales bacterium]|jgi:GMP synthase (glutamine-hydrolysing)|nr:glutamine-hydrolyzing GMP synthase [Pseudomonadales bacterium]MDP6471646.1 glutamine-hydrolyzing GMP synthase [Pseudomonadales bacterium]MDP6973068.1 glutamine-hydrolyzing GMP synthase [Pseudomonadales bacterium]
MTDIHDQRLLIIDFGSQYTQLIARRVREAGVYCEIHPYDVPDDFVAGFVPRGVILSGGPESVTEGETPRIPEGVLGTGVPVLGICYGMQAMAVQLGGKVAPSQVREFGHAVVTLEDSRLLMGVETGDARELNVWMSHADKVVAIPEGFRVTARTESAPIAAMEHAEQPLFGLQFHPEVTHTDQGAQIYRTFARDLCGCAGLWTPDNIIEDAIRHVRQLVNDEHVVLGLSGGVDSSVVAALLSRAIGDQLTCVFVDNGLLRKNEREEVEAVFAPTNVLNLNLMTVDAADEFLGHLDGLTDPEDKRKAIGNTFIDVFDRTAHSIESVEWLAQGTIYPDVIESAASQYGKAHVIKSHHNVGGLPERMRLKLIEPLRELFKDEVRAIGLRLGLPESLIQRHPFPGPGLGVRILGEVRREYAEVLREADALFIEELRESGWYEKTSQAFAVYLPVKSVGVVGDARRYEHVIALRAVETVDFMTARWAHLPYELIERVSNRIINEISQVSRVVYDVSSKPPATIEWE